MDSATESTCDRCGGDQVTRPVPDSCRGLLEDDPSIVRLCPRCCVVTPAPGTPVDRSWELPDAYPADPDAAVAVAILVTLLKSLALNRAAIEQVVVMLEQESGVDPLLALDRLAGSAALDPVGDLETRRSQLAQFLARE